MTVTSIDAKAALVVVDLQKGLLAATTVPYPIEDVILQSAKLAARFRLHDLPVVLVNVTGAAPGRTEAVRRTASRLPEWSDLVDELAVEANDVRITKQRWGAFYGTSLNSTLQSFGVTQVVLTGLATSIGVESTARSAYEHGYNVVLVTDAMSDVDVSAHTNSVERIFPKLGETGSVEEIIALLEAKS